MPDPFIYSDDELADMLEQLTPEQAVELCEEFDIPYGCEIVTEEDNNGV